MIVIFAPDYLVVVEGKFIVVQNPCTPEEFFVLIVQENESSRLLQPFFISNHFAGRNRGGIVVIRVILVVGGKCIEWRRYERGLPHPALLQFGKIIPVKGTLGIPVGIGLADTVGIDKQRTECTVPPETVPLALHGKLQAGGEGSNAVRASSGAFQRFCPDIRTVIDPGVGGHEVPHSVTIGHEIFV